MSSKINRLTFLINGVSSLLGWNAILSCFDYYQGKFPSQNVYLWFPIPLFLMYVVVGVTLHLMHRIFSYKLLILAGLIINNIVQILLPITAYYLKESSIGFSLCLALCGLAGFASNITQLSFFAIINYLSLDIVTIFNQGMAASGLVTILIRILILLIGGVAKANDFNFIVIYMVLTISVNTLDIILNIKFFVSRTYIVDIQSQENPALVEEGDEDTQLVRDEGHFTKLYKSHLEIIPHDVMILLNYVQTFMVFPSLVFAKPFSIPTVWGIALLNLFYNLGDLAGRIFCSYRKLFNKESLIYVFFARFVFYWTIIALAKNIDDSLLKSDAFAFMNIFLFALTNGIATSSC